MTTKISDIIKDKERLAFVRWVIKEFKAQKVWIIDNKKGESHGTTGKGK